MIHYTAENTWKDRLDTETGVSEPWVDYSSSSHGPPGARPTNDSSIEFEIRPTFGVLYVV